MEVQNTVIKSVARVERSETVKVSTGVVCKRCRKVGHKASTCLKKPLVANTVT